MRDVFAIPANASQDAGSAAGMTALFAPFVPLPPLETLCTTSLQCTIAILANASQGDGANAPFVLSFRTFSPCHPGLRAGILGSLMRGIALRCRLAIVILACASQGSLTRQLGGGSHPSVLPHQPRSVIPHLMRDPGRPCARYCIALLPSLPTPPRMPARRPA